MSERLMIGGGALCGFAIGMMTGGLIVASIASVAPSPDRMPVALAAKVAVHATPSVCTDARVNHIVAQTADVRHWHLVGDSPDWVTSRRYGVSLYQPYTGEVGIGGTDDDNPAKATAPDVDPVCRWRLTVAMQRLGDALLPPSAPRPFDSQKRESEGETR